MEYKILTFEEFEKKFKSVKHSKAVGQDDTDNKVYDGFSIHYLLFLTVHLQKLLQFLK